MGKRKLADSDSDDTDEDSSKDDEDNEKSVIIDNANSSDSANDGERSSDSLTGERQEGTRAAGGFIESGSEEEKETISQEISVSVECFSKESVLNQLRSMDEPIHHVDRENQGSTFPPSEAVAASDDNADQAGKEELDKSKPGNDDVATSQRPSDLINSREGSIIAVDIPHDTNGILGTKVVALDETAYLKANKGEEKPLNFEEYNSAAELEVLLS